MMMMKKNNKKNCKIGFRRRIVFQILIYIIGFQCIGILIFGGPKYELMDYYFWSYRNNDAVTTDTKSQYLKKNHRRRPTKKRMTIPFPPSAMITAVESPVLLQMMMKTKEKSEKDGSNIVVTRSTRQGYYFHKDFLDWNLDASLSSANNTGTSSSSTNFTKTICVTDQNRYIGSTQSIQERFYNIDKNKYNWSYLLYPPSKSKPQGYHELDNACKHSRVRILFERNGVVPGQKYTSKLKLKHLSEHVEGQQLTARILGGADVDKGSLITMIENSNSSSSSSRLLKKSIPKTYVFDSTESCQQFCINVWSNISQQKSQSQQSHWIFKPKFLSEGKGIIGIGPTLDDCRNHCITEGGNTLTAQSVLSNPLTLPDPYDKRKLDIRSIIFVANVHPLIVYTGGEYVRICAEPIIIEEEEEEWEWNKFQQICNMDVTKHISSYHDDPSIFVRPFLEETVIESKELRERLLKKLDQHNSALVELLYKERWTNPSWMDDNDYDNDHDNHTNNKTKTTMKNRNKVGMFQAFAADYLIANTTTENEIVLLELNSQPGYTGRFGVDYPNPWGDIMLIEWTILATYNKYHNNKATTKQQRHGGGDGDGDGVGEEEDDWKVELEQRLSELDLETLRRLKL